MSAFYADHNHSIPMMLMLSIRTSLDDY